MKLRHAFFLTLVILFLDQALKVYIKTNYFLGEEHLVIPALKWFRMHFIENEYFSFNQVPIFDNSIGTFYHFLDEILENKIFFVVFFMFWIQKLTFQYIVFFLYAMAMKTRCIGTGIDFNINVIQL